MISLWDIEVNEKASSIGVRAGGGLLGSGSFTDVKESVDGKKSVSRMPERDDWS